MHAINDFIIEYLFFPSAMLGYAFFMAAFIRFVIKEWLKERQEKKDAKNKTGGDAK
jgi:hypothetical protein